MVESAVQSQAEIVVGSIEKPKIRVLHVDDELGFLKVAKQCLELQGPFEVDTAGSVEEALAKLEKKHYNVVVSDYKMPEKDGLQFLKELREKGNSVPFAILTGKGREEIAIKALNLGADGYFSKIGSPETVYGELAHGILQAVQKKEADGALRESESKAKTLLESLPQKIFFKDRNSIYISCNENYARDLNVKVDEVEGKADSDFYPKELAEKYRADDRRIMESGKAEDMEEEYVKNGQKAFVHTVKTPVKDENGKIVGILGIFWDVTERKKAEREIESMAKFPAQDPEPVLRIGRDGMLLYANQAGRNLLEESRSKKDRALLEVLHRHVVDALSSNELAHFEEEHDGRTFRFRIAPIATESYANVYAADITERKQMEKQLKESEEKYKGLFENARDVIVLLDLKGNVTSINKRTEEYGFNESEMLGKNMLKFIPKRHWPKLLKDVAQIALGKTAKGIVEIHTSKGDRVAEYRSNPIFSDSRVVGIQTILEDTTEREKAEASLKESEERCRELTESIADVFFAMDKDFRYTYWNKASEKLTGISAKDAIGKSLTEVFPSVKGTKVEQFYQSTMKTKRHQTFVNEYQMEGKDFIFELNAYPTKEGLSVFVKDITERKKAEEALRESELKFRCLVEDALASIAITDAKGWLTYVNKATADMLGYSISEMVGKPFVNFLHPDDKGKVMRVFLKAILLRMRPRILDFRLVHKDGHALNMMSKPTKLVAGGKAIGFQAISIDVTERKKSEEALRISEEKIDTVIENANALFMAGNAKGQLTIFNKEFEELTGYSREEVLGKPFTILMPKEEHEKHTITFKKAFEGKHVRNYEITILTRNGQRRTIMFNSALLTDSDGNPIVTGIGIDITERKSAQAASKESEERFRGLFESIQDPVGIFVGREGHLIDCNAAFKKSSGYTDEELKGKVFLDFVHPDDRAMVLEKYRTEYSEDKFPLIYEIRGVNKKGECIPLELSVSPYKREGKVIGIEVIHRDLTERKKAEASLKESEEKYKDLFENAMDAMIILDLNGSITAVNNSILRFGYKKEDLVGKNILNFVSKEYWPAVMRDFSKVTQGEPAKNEIELVAPTGKILGEYHARAIVKERNAIGVQVNIRDMTERKKAEMSLRESQGRFEGLFKGNPEAAAYLGSDFRIQDINPRFEELFGYSIREANGKHINDVVVPDDRREEGEALDRDAIKGYVYRNTVRRKKDGSLVQVSISAAPITNESGITGIVAMYKDISDLKTAEKKLDMMNEKLRVVGGLTRHDVRNKLAAVAGNAHLLRKRLASDSDALECLKGVEAAVRESARIFDLASAYEQLGVEQLDYVDTKKTLDEAAGLHLDLKDTRMINDCGGLTLLADSLLTQLFYNLIDDSLKYGQKLTRIRIYYEKSGDQLKLIYEDDGVGIPYEAKPKLFIEGYTTGKGSGYGLYLIKKMIEVYGWTIQETGIPGKGVRFVIGIPEARPDGRQGYRLQQIKA